MQGFRSGSVSLMPGTLPSARHFDGSAGGSGLIGGVIKCCFSLALPRGTGSLEGRAPPVGATGGTGRSPPRPADSLRQPATHSSGSCVPINVVRCCIWAGFATD